MLWPCPKGIRYCRNDIQNQPDTLKGLHKRIASTFNVMIHLNFVLLKNDYLYYSNLLIDGTIEIYRVDFYFSIFNQGN